MMADESFKDYVLDLFGDWEVFPKRMFGGWGLFKEGIMFGLITGDELFFKVDKSNQEKYEERDSHPFIYTRQGKEVALSYWLVPEEIMEDSYALIDWALDSLEINTKLKK